MGDFLLSEAKEMAIEEAIDRLLELREHVQPHGSSEVCLLLDLLLFALGKQLAEHLDLSIEDPSTIQ